MACGDGRQVIAVLQAAIEPAEFVRTGGIRVPAVHRTTITQRPLRMSPWEFVTDRSHRRRRTHRSPPAGRGHHARTAPPPPGHTSLRACGHAHHDAALTMLNQLADAEDVPRERAR